MRLLALLLFVPTVALAAGLPLLATQAAHAPSSPAVQPVPAGAKVTPCFVPGQDCTDLIVQQIDAARASVLVQAYGFTSAPIIQALGRAKARGVDVMAILDKSNDRGKYSGATYLDNHGIPPLIDDKVTIAHNKIVIIDDSTVITGSFNFTGSAQQRNAENVLVLSNVPALAASYTDNWTRRAAVSRAYRGIPTQEMQ